MKEGEERREFVFPVKGAPKTGTRSADKSAAVASQTSGRRSHCDDVVERISFEVV